MILHGDCLTRLKDLADNSVDSVVTDPPYGLRFMGKKWDYDVPSLDVWREVYRVLKPGGHLLSFGGTRTYHRMVVAIEDAGFEIRDQIQWLYGSGFSKSHSIDKAIDKMHGAEREITGTQSVCGIKSSGGSKALNVERGYSASAFTGLRKDAPATPDAIKWAGFGTALKPANEPIVLARKPLEHGHTIAENVLKHGTGGLNIDASRIGTEVRTNTGMSSLGVMHDDDWVPKKVESTVQGRFPANLILGCACESDIHDEGCAVAMLDRQSGVSKSSDRIRKNKNPTGNGNTHGHMAPVDSFGFGDTGGASRFFYCAKSSKAERNAGLEGMPEIAQGAYGKFAGDGRGRQTEHQPTANHHPTVKPIRLMEYLIRLITPPGGICLDPFAGSGSTGVAAKRLGFEFIGIELNKEYVDIAEKRIQSISDMLSKPDSTPAPDDDYSESWREDK